MKRLKYIILPLILIALGVCSCRKVHQFPEPGKEVDPTEIETRVKIKCKVRLAGLNVVTKSSMSDVFLSDSADFYDRRFVVNIHGDEYGDTLVESHTIIREVTDTSALEIETKLQARKYKMVVWMDYVRKGSTTDLYYLCSNGDALDAIHQPQASKYVACSDFKDAQTFLSDIDLTPYANQWYADITITAPLERPLAKITFLANDLAEYASRIGYKGSIEELADDFSLNIRYDGYYPTGFNAYTGRLNDSQIGYGFHSFASYPYSFEQKDYTRIGFDYVFVNGNSSSVTVTVRVNRKDGQFVNEVNNVVVPITRGMETVVIFKFFTKEYVPGIGIDPGFDGEFDIYV